MKYRKIVQLICSLSYAIALAVAFIWAHRHPDITFVTLEQLGIFFYTLIFAVVYVMLFISGYAMIDGVLDGIWKLFCKDRMNDASDDGGRKEPKASASNEK